MSERRRRDANVAFWRVEARFTEEQIIRVLREQETGVPVADLCRKHGLSAPTFYKWKAKCRGMDVSKARRLKALEDENAKLKRLLPPSGSTLSAVMTTLVGKGASRRFHIPSKQNSSLFMCAPPGGSTNRPWRNRTSVPDANQKTWTARL
jgi:putative transposase